MPKFAIALFGLLALACGGQPAATPSPTASASASHSPRVSASPTAVSCAAVPPVYHPQRLQVLARCATFKGWVLADLHEQDGDRHLWLAPDAGYEGLLNAANVYHGHKALVAEIVPACLSEPADEAAAATCPASKLAAPIAGSHIEISGRWVLDTVHNWNEVHPVASLRIL